MGTVGKETLCFHILSRKYIHVADYLLSHKSLEVINRAAVEREIGERYANYKGETTEASSNAGCDLNMTFGYRH